MTRPWTPRLLAVVGPLLVVGLLLAPWLQPAEAQLSPDSIAIDKTLRDGPGPEIVILGNSLANRDIDPEQLTEELPGHPRVVTAWVSGTGPAAWYAVLQHRIYDQGYRPKVVVVLDLLERMFTTEPLTNGAQQKLLEQMAPDDIIILRKALGQDVRFAWVNRLRRNRDRWRASLLDGIRDRAVGALFAAPGQAPDHVAQMAIERVFDEGRLDRDRASRVIPVVEAADQELGNSESLSIRDSFVPDIAALAAEHGAKVVFVQAPLPLSNRVWGQLPPAFEAEVLGYLNELGVGWVDLRRLEFSESDFADTSHMNDVGAARATEYLGDVIQGWDLLGGGSPSLAVVPLTPASVERTGEPPPVEFSEPTRVDALACTFDISVPKELNPLTDGALRKAGLKEVGPLVIFRDGKPIPAHHPPGSLRGDCTGGSGHLPGRMRFTAKSNPREVVRHQYTVGWSPEVPVVGRFGVPGWWLYPGTRLRWTFDEPLDEPTTIAFIGQVLGEGGGRPVLRSSSAQSEVREAGDMVQASLVQAPTQQSWFIEFESPVDAAPVAIRSLSIGDGSAQSFLVGDHSERGMQSLRLTGLRRTERGRIHKVVFADPPGDVAHTVPRQRDDGMGVIRLRDDVPSMKVLLAQRMRGAHYLELYAKGQPLPGRWGTPGQLKNLAEVTKTQAGSSLLFVVPPGVDVADVDVRLRADRRVGAVPLLYPGDEVTIEHLRPPFTPGADSLQLVVTPLVPDPDGSLSVLLEAAGHLWVDDELPLDGPVSKGWEFPARIPEGQPVSLTVSSSSETAWVALQAISLDMARPFDELPSPGGIVARVDEGSASDADGALVFVGGGRPPKFRSKADPAPFEVVRVDRGSTADVLTIGEASAWSASDPVSGRDCSAVQVHREGVEVPVRAGPADTLTVDPGRGSYTARADPRRTCHDSMWLYPGDVLRLRPVAGPPSIDGDAVVRLEGATDDAGAKVVLRLVAGREKLFDAQLRYSDLNAGVFSAPFEPTTSVQRKRLVAVLVNRGERPVLIARLDLVPAAP